jgi:hypothetical protein
MNTTSFTGPGRFSALSRAAGLAGCLVIALALGLAPSRPAYADTPPDEADPPDRAARLSYIQGEVSLQPAGEEEWASAIVNRPLTTGDKLWTDEGARAEIYVGPAAVRLGGDTGFSFLNVDDNTIQMRMTAGVMDVRVRALDENDQIEIDTPNLALSLLRPGRYRVEVNDEGDTTVVKVLEGEAEASGGSQDTVVHAQQSATFRGTEQLAAQFGSLGVPDAFDSWTLERDRRDQQAQSAPAAQYVSPEVTGYEDLDANGSWSSDPEYGNVWTPTAVAVDWSPYRYGRWVWVAPWGWTWIDDAPWGYAPFHYGRWAHSRNRWCWVPGPRHVRAVYAPALVGWVGSPGVSVSVSVGGGGVAWFPLGPREVYVPARRYSPRYVERVNVSNTVIVNKTYITNVYNNKVTNINYRNRAVPGGVTAVSRTTFTSAERVGRNTIRVNEREITRVSASGMAPQIRPGRQSVLGMSEAGRRNVRTPPAAVLNRQVIVKREPPAGGAHFVRNAGQAGVGRGRPDERPQNRPDRNDAGNRNPAADRNQAGNRDSVVDRNEAAGRNRPNAGNDARNHVNRAGDVAPNASGNDAASAADRDRAARDANAGRNGQASTDERPPQSRSRNDRPSRAERPAIPDHTNRAGDTVAQPSSDRLQNEERQSRANRSQQDLDAARVEREQRQQQQQADRQRHDQEMQANQQQRQQEMQADQQQHQQQIQRDQQRREQQQAQQDQQRREQQSQNEQRRQLAQQDQQRREQQQSQQEQQRREQQSQQDQQRRQQQEAQRAADRQRDQARAAAQQSQDRGGSTERHNRPEPARQAEQSKPQPQERERRRPDNANTREP